MGQGGRKDATMRAAWRDISANTYPCMSTKAARRVHPTRQSLAQGQGSSAVAQPTVRTALSAPRSLESGVWSREWRGAWGACGDVIRGGGSALAMMWPGLTVLTGSGPAGPSRQGVGAPSSPATVAAFQASTDQRVRVRRVECLILTSKVARWSPTSTDLAGENDIRSGQGRHQRQHFFHISLGREAPKSQDSSNHNPL